MMFRYFSLFILYINIKIGKNRCKTSRWPPVWETAVHLALAGGVFDGFFLCCLFPPLDVLDEIWDVFLGDCLPTLRNSEFRVRNSEFGIVK